MTSDLAKLSCRTLIIAACAFAPTAFGCGENQAIQPVPAAGQETSKVDERLPRFPAGTGNEQAVTRGAIPPAIAESTDPPPPDHYRMWASVDGSFTTEAALFGLDRGVATLHKKDGANVKFPVEKLTDADRDFVSRFEDDLVGNVVGLADGDTVTLLTDDHRQRKIRLEGIDAPESSQDFGKASRKELGDLVFRKDIRVQNRGTDKYGRTLGYIFLGNEWVNLHMVKAGLAWHYKKYSSDPELAQAEVDARRQKVGLWSRDDAMPPWVYRHPPAKATVRPLAAQPRINSLLSRPPSTPSALVPGSPSDSESDSETVYVTKSGRKYHRVGCRHLQKSAIPLSLSEARQRYTPCAACNPP